MKCTKLPSEVFCSFILKDNKKRKHIVYFKILEAVESFVSGNQGPGFLYFLSQQGQEFTWGNAFALGVRPWIAANNLYLHI